MKAIDTHVHFSTKQGYVMKDPQIVATPEQYLRIEVSQKSEDEMAQDLIEADVKGVVLPLDAEVARGWAPDSNDYAAEIVERYPEAFVGAFAAIDPWKGKRALRELERAGKQLGMIGVNFQQAIQEFYPNDRCFYPIYEKCVELKVAVLFHVGIHGAGTGLPGGAGFRLNWTRPIPYIDDVAADFPDLTIICAHPAWPWQEEMIAVLLHKGNVYADLSGWAPRYFPDSLVREIDGRLQDKLMFGSGYPLLHPKRWLKEFESMGFKSEVMQKVLLKNAIRVLGLKV